MLALWVCSSCGTQSSLTATVPAVITIPSGVQEELCSQHENFQALTYFRYHLILRYYENDPKNKRCHVWNYWRDWQESAVRVCIYCLVSWKRFFGFRFLIILFVLSSLHYGKDTLGLCPQWIHILVVVGRLTFMTNLTNNVIQYNLVLNCKVQKSALLRTGDCKGNF